MKEIANKGIYLIAGILLISSFRTASNDVKEEKIQEDRFITVTGSADMLVPPDEISVEISYQEYWYNYKNKSKASIKEIEKKIVAAIEKAGISRKDIFINSDWAWKYNRNYWHYWYNYNNYMHQKNLTVKLASSAQLDKIIKNLKGNSVRKEGILNISLNGSSNKDIKKYRKMVKERAIQAAQEKADYLLKALGESRGEIISISELDDPQTTKTTRQHRYYDYWGLPYYGGWGGYNEVTSSPNTAISNSSVAMPSGGGSGNPNKTDDMSMKPIKLRYDIQAVFRIGA